MEKTSQIIIQFAKLFCWRRQWNVIRPRGQTVELQLHERRCSPDVSVPEWCRFKSSGVALWRTEITSKGFQNKTSHNTNNLVFFFFVRRKAHVRRDNHCFRSTLICSGNLFWQQTQRLRVKRRELWEFFLPGFLLVCRVSFAFLRTVPACRPAPSAWLHPPPLTSPAEFSYFLFNAVTYGPVLYLLSAMQF